MKDLQFRIEPGFTGPVLAEMLPILADVPAPVAVQWTGSRTDFLALESVDTPLILVVPDADTQERTCWALGVGLDVPPEERDASRASLVTRGESQTWRSRLTDVSHSRSSMLLCKLVTDNLRAGKHQGPIIVGLASECITDRLNPIDADVLLRLRADLRS